MAARERLSGDRKGDEEGKDDEGVARIRLERMSAKGTGIDGSVEHCIEKADTLEEVPEIGKTRGETLWGVLLEADGNSKIETVAMKQETKKIQTKALWTVVKFEEEMKSGKWTSVLASAARSPADSFRRQACRARRASRAICSISGNNTRLPHATLVSRPKTTVLDE